MYHCSATSYADTDWQAILRLYDAMLTIHRSPVYLINRAIVVAEIAGPAGGHQRTERDEREFTQSGTTTCSMRLWASSTGTVRRRRKARPHLEAAKSKTRSPHDRTVIDRRLGNCL